MGFELLQLEGATVRWASSKPGEPPRVTYAIARDAMSFDKARNCSEIVSIDTLLGASHIERSQFDRELKAAFDLWQQAANIEFTEAADTESADIVIGAQASPTGRAFANVDYKPGLEPHAIRRSLICLNPQQPWKIGFDGNLSAYDLRYTLAHEIGHAIGLDHPSPEGQLMSFKYAENFRQLQAGDLSGVARIYGTRNAAPLSRN